MERRGALSADVTGSPDPDVARRIDDQCSGAWVLVTMDLTVVEDYSGFDWNRYAIAWVVVHETLAGARVEQAKHEIVHRHAHKIREQGAGRSSHLHRRAALHDKTEPEQPTPLKALKAGMGINGHQSSGATMTRAA
jgi:hypothetical protein